MSETRLRYNILTTGLTWMLSRKHWTAVWHSVSVSIFEGGLIINHSASRKWGISLLTTLTQVSKGWPHDTYASTQTNTRFVRLCANLPAVNWNSVFTQIYPVISHTFPEEACLFCMSYWHWTLCENAPEFVLLSYVTESLLHSYATGYKKGALAFGSEHSTQMVPCPWSSKQCVLTD